jgi:hypothetical protein
MVAGRPRTAVPEKDELIELGKDLVNWASEQTEELRCQYCQWYSLKHGFIKKQWEQMREKPEFQCYYEQARVCLGLKYVDGTINQSIAHRFLRVYVPEVKEQEDEDAIAESERKKSILLAAPPNDDNVDAENHQMSENHRLRKKVEELQAKLDNIPQAGPEL